MTYFTAEIERTKGIRKFFKAKEGNITSYYQYKGTLFKTETINYSGYIPLSLEEVRMLITNFKILYGDDEKMCKLLEIEKLERELDKIQTAISKVPTNERKSVEIDLLQRLIRVNSFKKVKVKFASDICMFWCPFCKDLFFEIDIDIDTEHNYPICPKCDKKILQQTPVWVLKNDTGQQQVIHPLIVWVSEYNKKYLWDCWRANQYVECLKCENGKLKKYYSTDPARIYESSKLQCENCKREYRLFSKNYSLTAPTENITIPFVVSVFNKSSIYYDKTDLKSIIENVSVRPPFFETKYIDQFLFSPKIVVKELVIGFWHGIHAKRLIPSEKTGLELCTSGVYIKLNNNYFDDALKFLKKVHRENPEKIKKLEKISPYDPIFKRTVLHSLAHSILNKLPIYSGISIDNFGYIYDINTSSVLIYERCEGGLGACYILTQMDEEKGTGEFVLHDFINEIRETIKTCNCDDSCKYCLALVGCQEFNSHLDRFSLGPLFNLKAEDLSWGF